MVSYNSMYVLSCGSVWVGRCFYVILFSFLHRQSCYANLIFACVLYNILIIDSQRLHHHGQMIMMKEILK